jgi:uncharacterized protein DUF2274
MDKLKLSGVPDDKPVKLTVELPAAVHRDLTSYAEILSGTPAKPSSRRNWSLRCWPVSCRQTEPFCERAEKSKRQSDLRRLATQVASKAAKQNLLDFVSAIPIPRFESWRPASHRGLSRVTS